MSYTNPDGAVNSFDAGPDGRYTASRTPKDGVKSYLAYDPANPGNTSGGYVLPQVALTPGATSYDFGGGVSVTQNADGVSQYQVALPGGGSTAIQVDGSGAHFKVYDAGGALIGIASTHYDANGQYVYTPEPLPPPPPPPPPVYYPTDSGSSTPSSSGSSSSGFTPAMEQAIRDFLATNPTDVQIAAAAASVGFTANQVAAGLNLVAGAGVWSGGSVAGYVNTNLSGQYAVGSGGVIVAGTPIVIDLNGDGVSLVPLALSTAAFDIAGTGERLKTGWVAPGDALLAYDADGNGAIDHFNEISYTGYLPGTATDLEGLAAFDSNHDGKLTAQDTLWNKLQLWRDKNQNGVSDAGELSTLADFGIVAIGLDSDHQAQVRDGNVIYGFTHFTRTDGSTGLVGDVKFDFDLPGHTGTDGNDVLSGGYILAANDYEWQNAA